MPNWRQHLKTAKFLGIGPTVAKDVTRMLDNPTDPNTGEKLPHKEIHDNRGLAMAYLLHGEEGLRLAATHMMEDKISETIKERYSGGEYGDLIAGFMISRILGIIGKSFHRPSTYHP